MELAFASVHIQLPAVFARLAVTREDGLFTSAGLTVEFIAWGAFLLAEELACAILFNQSVVVLARDDVAR